MRFNIITPTFNRSDELVRAIDSVISQSYSDWRMIIINDSPDASYQKVEEKIKNNPKIIYITYKENMGVNFSRNRGLDIIDEDSTENDWVILLDDDDVFAKEALKTFSDLIKDNPNEKWFITNRSNYDGKSFTKAPKPDSNYSYLWDYLITKRFSGDATHCINFNEIKNVRFSKKVKQAEEWIFFYEVSRHIKKFFYHSFNSTLTSGYTMQGLNFRKRNKKEKFLTLISLNKETRERKISFSLGLQLYFIIRLLILIF